MRAESAVLRALERTGLKGPFQYQSGGSGCLRGGLTVAESLGDLADIGHENLGQTVRCGRQFARGGPHVLLGRGADQFGLLCSEWPAVSVYEPLAGAGAFHVEVRQQRHYLGSRSHSWSFRQAGLPVVRVLAVLAGAVQRPGCEPAAVMNLKAQRADHRSIRKIPPQVVTHDIGDIPRWSTGQGRLRCLGAVNSRGPAVRPALDTVSLAAPARTCTTGGCAMSTERKKFADDVRVEKRRLDASENDALIGIARMGADAFGYTADLRIDRQLAQLLRLRVSQLNNCTYCLNLHYQAAREAGIPRAKIDTLSAWWETELYSAAEQAALRYAEALTRAADTDQDAAFQRFHDALAENFSREQMLEIVGVVVNMNVWTRIKLAEGAMPSLA